MGKTNRKLLQIQLRALVTTHPKTTQQRICEIFKVSRPTVKRWLDQIRDEQLAKIDQKSLTTELWRLQERAKEYLMRLEDIDDETKQYSYNRPISTAIKMVQLSWQIEKELFDVRLNLFSIDKKSVNFNTFDQKIGIGTMNVNKG